MPSMRRIRAGYKRGAKECRVGGSGLHRGKFGPVGGGVGDHLDRSGCRDDGSEEVPCPLSESAYDQL